MPSTDRHKVFVSYHHDMDEAYKKHFCTWMRPDIVDRSVEDGDINPHLAADTIRAKIRDEFIADATVTVVLIGRCTWQRKHVDWEIGSSLRDTKNNPRCGLLGILLQTHYNYGNRQYRPNLIPPRLADNCNDGNSFAKVYDWPDPWKIDSVRAWIHAAFQRRFSSQPRNVRDQFKHNRSGICTDGWAD